MKDKKTNPQYTNLNFEENSNQKRDETQGTEKRLEDKPGAYLLKEKAADEEIQENEASVDRSDLNEEVTAEDEIDLDPFEDENLEIQD